MNDTIKKILKEWIIPVATIIIVTSLLTKYICFFVLVPTGSMIPTIKERSFLFATRVHDPEKLERGDIVVFYSDELQELLVKRLIGLPGDSVIIDDKGFVSVNGTVQEESYVRRPSYQSGEFEVPENSYFFLGDNRSGSYDARSWQQPYINEEKIEGKAIFTLWPLNKFGILK